MPETPGQAFRRFRRIIGGLVLAAAVVSAIGYVIREPRVRVSICAGTREAPATEPARRYETSFPVAEDPIREGERWVNGEISGLDWTNVRTAPGLAFGTQTGRRSGASAYDDSTALLSGSWGGNQAVEATVHSVNPNDDIIQEVELRLRSSFSPHCASGYEVNFRCSKTMNAYAEIVRWNGRLGDYTYLDRKTGAEFGVADGDVVSATVTDDTITAYINGRQVLQARDTTRQRGSPGIGFYLRGATPTSNCGLTRFAASAPSQHSNPVNYLRSNLQIIAPPWFD